MIHLIQMFRKLIDILQLWDGSNEIDAGRSTIYNKFIYEYLSTTFKDEMGTTLYQQFNETHLMKRVIADQLLRKESIWWDDINTQAIVETRKDILSKSLISTVKALRKSIRKRYLYLELGTSSCYRTPTSLGQC